MTKVCLQDPYTLELCYDALKKDLDVYKVMAHRQISNPLQIETVRQLALYYLDAELELPAIVREHAGSYHLIKEALPNHDLVLAAIEDHKFYCNYKYERSPSSPQSGSPLPALNLLSEVGKTVWKHKKPQQLIITFDRDEKKVMISADGPPKFLKEITYQQLAAIKATKLMRIMLFTSRPQKQKSMKKNKRRSRGI